MKVLPFLSREHDQRTVYQWTELPCCTRGHLPFLKLYMLVLPTSDCSKAQWKRLPMIYNMRWHRAPGGATSDQDQSAKQWIKQSPVSHSAVVSHMSSSTGRGGYLRGRHRPLSTFCNPNRFWHLFASREGSCWWACRQLPIITSPPRENWQLNRATMWLPDQLLMYCMAHIQPSKWLFPHVWGGWLSLPLLGKSKIVTQSLSTCV